MQGEFLNYGPPESPSQLQAEGISSRRGTPSALRGVGPPATASGMELDNLFNQGGDLYNQGGDLFNQGGEGEILYA